MALDRSLIGVIGASSALFVLFCVLAAIVGCFCLRRARQRRQQSLIEKTLKERRERESHHHNGSHYMTDTINSRPTLSNGGSVARSDLMPQKMAEYRPKILEDNMISKGYRRDSHASRDRDHAAKDNKAVSTILVNEPQPIPEAVDTSLNYNQSNGFIVKGYLRSSGADHRVHGEYHGGSTPGYMVYGYPVGQYGMTGPEHQDGRPPTGRQVIKQTVEMGHDGKLVVARSERQFVDPVTGSVMAGTSSEPVATPHQGTVALEGRERSQTVKPAGETHTVSFGSPENAARLGQTPTEQSTETMTRNHRQRDDQETFETRHIRSPSVPEESNQHNKEQLSNGAEAGVATAMSSGHVTHTASISEEPSHTGSNTEGIHGVPDTPSHPVSPKSSRQDNYKVIRREHSGHSKMPEWNEQAQSVNEKSLGQRDGDTGGLNDQVIDTSHTPGLWQQPSPGQRSGAPGGHTHRATTAQFYHQFADPNNNSQREISQGGTISNHFTPISPASDSTTLQTILHRPQTKRSAERRSGVTFQDRVEVVGNGSESGLARLDIDDDDEQTENPTDSASELAGFRPVGQRDLRARDITPKIPRNYKDFMDNLPESDIF